MLYEDWARPLLFRLDPERAHQAAVGSLRLLQTLPLGSGILRAALGAPPRGLDTVAFGIRFPNPVGLAAGFDKDCLLSRVLPSLGFGFLEGGSVTLRPQPGNPKPRIFRFPEREAIINRMGFNSRGATAAARSLARAGRCEVPLGINLGLNKDVASGDIPSSYAETFRALEPYGDYFAINVSSPNTTGLRDLQDRVRLAKILEAIDRENLRKKPVLIKLSPDLSDAQLEDLLPLIEKDAAGVIAANTTVSRDGLPADMPEIRGGLSGAPLRARSTALIKKIYNLTDGRLPIVGVGGVMTGADAFEKILAGASLVQIYTSIVYRGPAAALRIQQELSRQLAAHGFTSVSAAVGRGARESLE